MEYEARIFIKHLSKHLKPINDPRYFPAQKIGLIIMGTFMVGDVSHQIKMYRIAWMIIGFIRNFRSFERRLSSALIWAFLIDSPIIGIFDQTFRLLSGNVDILNKYILILFALPHWWSIADGLFSFG